MYCRGEDTVSKKPYVSMSVIRRLPRYYRFVSELKNQGIERISSQELSRTMNITASQIRQDFNCFGEFGLQGYGYNVVSLLDEIHKILGIELMHKTILIGAGNLGKAIVSHMDFKSNGFILDAIFDNSPSLIGQNIYGNSIQSTENLSIYCKKNKPEVAILCVPNEVVLSLCTELVNNGVKGFWNFSHIDIAQHFPDAVVENVHLSDALMTLCYRLKPENNESEKI